MFPYTMLATTAIFYSNDWPKRFYRFVSRKESPDVNSLNNCSNLSPHCIYEKILRNDDADQMSSANKDKTKAKKQVIDITAWLLTNLNYLIF